MNRPLVLAHGCFDPLHIGHIRYLKAARQLGQSLHVGVTADRSVKKGIGRPRFNQVERAEAIDALGCVDHVWTHDGENAVPLIEHLRPDIYAKGIDYDGSADPDLQLEIDAVQRCGGRFEIVRTPLHSSSRLLNGERYSDELLKYFEKTRQHLPAIEKAFADARAKKVLFLGEAITDWYVYVAPLAKPAKELVLATTEVGEENFMGGIHAAAAHLDGLCEYRIVTQHKPIVKKRFVDATFKRKLFETYSVSHLQQSEPERECIEELLEEHCDWANMIVVIDFGHGLIDERIRSGLTFTGKFVAVNAQSNAGNAGFNPVSRYSANYICVDVPEARLAVQNQHGPLEDVINQLGWRCGGQIIVTAGSNGAYWHSGGHAPALDAKPIDTMGAGDCFLAYTAPLIACGLELEAAALVGNVAASIKTEILGHQRHVDHELVLQTCRSLLK